MLAKPLMIAIATALGWCSQLCLGGTCLPI
jgi:hypothetical protein